MSSARILDDEGDRADRPFLFELAKRFEMPIITIEDLIRFRRQRERLVERIAEAQLPTRCGNFRIIAYGVKYESQQPIALVAGDLRHVAAPLVRLHSSCFTGDLLASLRCDCGDQLRMALETIGREGTGVLVYLPQEGRGIGLVEKIRAYGLQDTGLDTVEANLALGYQADVRDYGIGIQILKDLGLSQVRLLTNNPKKTDAFIYGGFDLKVVDQVPILPPINEHNAQYLATKRDKMGHSLPKEVWRKRAVRPPDRPSLFLHEQITRRESRTAHFPDMRPQTATCASFHRSPCFSWRRDSTATWSDNMVRIAGCGRVCLYPGRAHRIWLKYRLSHTRGGFLSHLQARGTR